MFGKNRTREEDPRLCGIPGIWLSNEKLPVNGNMYSYRYMVEVDENDPNLIEDKTVTVKMESIGDTRWYGYLKEIKPSKMEVSRGLLGG
ncbi:hypothetical protein SPSIL_048890 [Sporomusa silvacetica DSM 10669]|uniref:Uncharacterized protein n=1 Tax=Sporomusa silvacetica DSM 10669 TaxID=1123289 RepID=A0ABZ3ISG9_9FIRM|nr:hypothetical protein [Sporomusa silvacetica]OZC19425.1 hypothetical protein SPSIL_21250 [Sporomusa silvacetica DSM 10669]